VKTFLKFALVSGAGWLCDASVFWVLIRFVDVSPPIANFVSSYVGLTFVYITSLRLVFHKNDRRRGRFLLLYWGYQLLSILTYSLAIGRLAQLLGALDMMHPGLAGMGAKVLVTPLNLGTNFLFLRVLTRFMIDGLAARTKPSLYERRIE
jgi:putative flippase GtrA